MLKKDNNIGYYTKRPEITIVQYNYYESGIPVEKYDNLEKCWSYSWIDHEVGFESDQTGLIRINPLQVMLLPPLFKYTLYNEDQSYKRFYINFTFNEKFVESNSRCFLLTAPLATEFVSNYASLKNRKRLLALRMYGLLYDALNRVGDHEIYLRPEPHVSPMIKRVLDNMDIVVGLPRKKNAEYAEDAKMSPRHFLRKFKSETGVTPQHYKLMKRIERAKTYLKVINCSIDEAAMHTGFSDRYSFSKAFKKITGLTPAAFRNGMPRHKKQKCSHPDSDQ